MPKPYIQTPREFLEGFIEQYVAFGKPDQSISGADTVESLGKIYRIAKKVLKAHKADPAVRLTSRQRAATLAGLRMVQRVETAVFHNTGFPPGIEEILTDRGRVKPLRAEEIDTLCWRINHG